MSLASPNSVGSQELLLDHSTNPNQNQWQIFAKNQYEVNKDRFGSSNTSAQSERSPKLHPPQPPPPPINTEPPCGSQPCEDIQSPPHPITPWQRFAKEHSDSPQQPTANTIISNPMKLPQTTYVPLRKSVSDKVQRSELDAKQQKGYSRVGHTPWLHDPPLCFCGKAAAWRVVPGIGTIYECFNTDLECNTSATSKRVVCTFHIHKQPWDRFRQTLKDGKCVDYNDMALNECPAFNYTFRVVFRIVNKWPFQPLSFPNCFCNTSTVCRQVSQRCGNRFVFICLHYEHDVARPKSCCWLMWAEQVKVLQPPLLHLQDIHTDNRRINGPIAPKAHFSSRTTVPSSSPPIPLAMEQNDNSNQRDKYSKRHDNQLIPSNNCGVVTTPSPLPTEGSMERSGVLDNNYSKEDGAIYSRRQLLPQSALFPTITFREHNPKSNDFIRLLSDGMLPSGLDQASLAKDTTADTLSSDNDLFSEKLQSGAVNPTTTTTTTATATTTPAFAFKMNVPTTVLARRAIENKAEVEQLLEQIQEEEKQVAEYERKRQEIADELENTKFHLQQLIESRDELEEEAGEDTWLMLEKEKKDITCQLELMNISLKDENEELQKSEQFKAIYSRAADKLAARAQDLEESIAQAEEMNEKVSMRHFKCRVCFQENIQVALVPCFHCSYCENCADKLSECAICRVAKFEVQRITLD